MVAKWWEVRYIYVIIKLSSLFMNKIICDHEIIICLRDLFSPLRCVNFFGSEGIKGFIKNYLCKRSKGAFGLFLFRLFTRMYNLSDL